MRREHSFALMATAEAVVTLVYWQRSRTTPSRTYAKFYHANLFPKQLWPNRNP